MQKFYSPVAQPGLKQKNVNRTSVKAEEEWPATCLVYDVVN